MGIKISRTFAFVTTREQNQQDPVMRGIILSVFATLAVAGAFGASTFDEKSDAIKEIEKKLEEVDGLGHLVLQQIDMEINKRESVIEDATKQEAEKLKTALLTEFAEEIKKAARTAVAKGKPLSTFECLAKLSLEGRREILKLHEDFNLKVDWVIGNREDRFYLAIIETRLILDATTQLAKQSVEKIREAKTGIENLKADALKKIESGNKQLRALESNIHKPAIAEEYNALKTEMNKKFPELKDTLFKKVQKCVS